jgi:hypothetical protein
MNICHICSSDNRQTYMAWLTWHSHICSSVNRHTYLDNQWIKKNCTGSFICFLSLSPRAMHSVDIWKILSTCHRPLDAILPSTPAHHLIPTLGHQRTAHPQPSTPAPDHHRPLTAGNPGGPMPNPSTLTTQWAIPSMPAASHDWRILLRKKTQGKR